MGLNQNKTGMSKNLKVIRYYQRLGAEAKLIALKREVEKRESISLLNGNPSVSKGPVRKIYKLIDGGGTNL